MMKKTGVETICGWTIPVLPGFCGITLTAAPPDGWPAVGITVYKQKQR